MVSHEKNSEIYTINHSDGTPIEVSDDTRDILRFSLKMARETKGAFDLTIFPVLTAWGFTTGSHQIPTKNKLGSLISTIGYEKIQLQDNTLTLPQYMQIDLGAVGKGYIGDLVIEVLKKHGISSALINLGGNVQTIGAKPDRSAWKIGLKHPVFSDILCMLEIMNKCVVTSGAYERFFIGEDGKKYAHILDRTTGKPVISDIMSISVIGEEGKFCDSLSTAMFVMGLDKSLVYWQESGNFDMIILTDKNELYLTEGLIAGFTMKDGYQTMRVTVLKK